MILADEELTINRKTFIPFCAELIARDPPKRVKWGVNTRVTDILRDAEQPRLYRKAGFVRVALRAEAAAQLKLDLFNKATKVADNARAIRRPKEADIFIEAQFIVGMENEADETLEKSYRFARDWDPDLANRPMYTHRPHSPLVQALGDKVEVFDCETCNFVTPVMKPAAMNRAELLDRSDEHLSPILYERRHIFICDAEPGSAGCICWAASKRS